MNFVLAAGSPLDHVVSHPIIRVGSLVITNHMIMAALAGVLMLLFFPWIFSRPKSDAPTGIRNFFESILQFLRTDVIAPSLKQHTDRFTPFLWTVFFFILFCNLLGFIPLGQVVTVIFGERAGAWNEVGGTATGNIATTGALAVAAFFFIHLGGIWQVARDLMAGTYGHHGHEGGGERAGHGDHAEHDTHGGSNPVSAILAAPWLYIWNFAPHLFMPKPGESKIGWLADIPVWGGLLFLEIIGAFIKPFALCMRLFANMIAGHIVLAVLAGLIVLAPTIAGQIGIGIPVLVMSLMIRILELFVCFLQAYIFTYLTTLFIAAAVAPEH